MKTNDYDAFAAEKQKRLRSGQEPPHRYVEKPAMKSILPNLQGKKVLLLGCGTGEEVILIEEFGANEITGIDISKNSISLASKTYPTHTFQSGDMHNLKFGDATFDFVYSSLSVHYSANPESVYREVHRVLKSNGRFQFSTIHPVRWGSTVTRIDGKDVKMLGYSIDYENKPLIYGDYNNFHKQSEKMAHGEILEYWVGPPSMHFSLLQKVGFTVKSFIETTAIQEAKEELPYYYDRFSRFPQFAIFAADKC